MSSSPPPRPDASHPFQSALLLTDHNTNASVDRTVLRAVGVRQVRVLTSGVEAARYLAERVHKVLPPSTELVVCLPALADMGAADFAALTRLHPLLNYMPLLAIIAVQGQEIFLKQAGFNAVLIRPFTATMLQQLLAYMGREARATRATLIASLRQRGAVPGHDTFDRRLQSFIPPDRTAMSAEDCYRQGRDLLGERRWDEALPYLQKAAADGSTQGEACLALAALWRGRGETGKIRACLLGALQGFLESAAWGKAQVLTRRLLTEYPDQPNPVLRELERRARIGRLDGLPDMAGLALDFVSQEELVETLLNGCAASSEPATALDALLESFRDEEWAALVKALEQAAGRSVENPVKRRGWLRRALSRTRRDRTAPLEPGTPDGNTHEQDEVDEEISQPPDMLRADPSDGSGLPAGAVIAPLGQEVEGLRPSRLPGPLGDALTVIRGTRRLYRSVK